MVSAVACAASENAKDCQQGLTVCCQSTLAATCIT